MTVNLGRVTLTLVSTAVLASSAGAWFQRALAQDAPPASPAKQPDVKCTMDLTRPGVMRDILSNALTRTPNPSISRSSPAEFLNRAVKECATGDELVRATAEHFKIDQEALAAEVERFR